MHRLYHLQQFTINRQQIIYLHTYICIYICRICFVVCRHFLSRYFQDKQNRDTEIFRDKQKILENVKHGHDDSDNVDVVVVY